MEYEGIALLAAFAVFYSTFAGAFERTPVNGAVIFVAFGFIVGPFGLGALRGELEAEGLRTLAEFALALVLFSDASSTDLKVLARAANIPRRLILISLPLSIIIGFGAGFLIFGGLHILSIAIIAVILAPTDAALGKAVVSNKAVPAEIREGLNFESGLNDGVCVPIFIALLTLAASAEVEGGFSSLALTLAVEELGVGAVVGAVVTFMAYQLVRLSETRGWINEGWMQAPVVATAILCFAAAQSLHGSGFIAAFVGGLLFRVLAGGETHRLVESAEGAGDAMTMLAWITFGAFLVGQIIDAITVEVVIFSVFALTIMRIAPVVLALHGVSLSLREKLFIGWFGPRGLATVVFSMMVLESGIPEARTIVATATCAVLLSVLAHGLSALPIIRSMFPEGRA